MGLGDIVRWSGNGLYRMTVFLSTPEKLIPILWITLILLTFLWKTN